jgi:hypothetical protein
MERLLSSLDIMGENVPHITMEHCSVKKELNLVIWDNMLGTKIMLSETNQAQKLKYQ